MSRRSAQPPIDDLATETRAWLRVELLAAYWDVTLAAVRKWIRAGVLPASRFGRAWRVRVHDARTFECANRVSRDL